MVSRVPTITITVRPGDLMILMRAARQAIDLGKIDIEGEQFEIMASIGAIEKALGRAQAA
jgi:hypothetical protein